MIQHVYHHPTNDGPWNPGTGMRPGFCYRHTGGEGYRPCGRSKSEHLSVAGAVDEAFAQGMYQHRGEILPFAEWLVFEVKPRTIVEIGAWKGGTALLWGRIATEKVISIDLPMGTFGGADAHLDEARCAERNRMLADKIPGFMGVLGDSHDAETIVAVLKDLEGDPVDLLFIDGDHTYAGVRQDFLLYSPLVRSGGWVAFHDIADTERHTRDGVEVRKLWLELSGEKKEWRVEGDFGGIGAVRV